MSGWNDELARRLLERAEQLRLDPDWDPVYGYGGAQQEKRAAAERQGSDKTNLSIAQ